MIILSLASVLIFVVWHAIKVFENFPTHPEESAQVEFLDQVEFLETHTETGAIIGMPGGGVSAYFIKDRQILNLDGLINTSGYFERMKSGTAEIYYDEIGLDYVFGNKIVFLESDPYWWFFHDRLTPVENLKSNTLFIYDALGGK